MSLATHQDGSVAARFGGAIGAGQNLFDRAHQELAGPEVAGAPSLEPRRAGVRLMRKF